MSTIQGIHYVPQHCNLNVTVQKTQKVRDLATLSNKHDTTTIAILRTLVPKD
jgi:hypothetical protein